MSTVDSFYNPFFYRSANDHIADTHAHLDARALTAHVQQRAACSTTTALLKQELLKISTTILLFLFSLCTYPRTYRRNQDKKREQPSVCLMASIKPASASKTLAHGIHCSQRKWLIDLLTLLPASSIPAWSLRRTGVLGDSLGALRHGVLGKLSRENESHSGLDLARGEGSLQRERAACQKIAA
jgi:hypothetical protein